MTVWSGQRPAITAKIGLIVLLLHGCFATAEESVIPQQSEVCIRQSNGAYVVDKRALSNFLLDATHVSRNYQQSVPTPEDPKLKRLPAEEGIFLICKTKAACPGAAGRSVDNDFNALIQARFAYEYVLGNLPKSFENKKNVSTLDEFLLDDTAILECKRDAKGNPVEGTRSGRKSLEISPRVRLRGSTDQLYFPRTDPAYSLFSVPKATVSAQDSGTSNTRTIKVTGVVGYETYEDLRYRNIVYVGVNKNITDTTGQTKKVSADTVDVGMLNGVCFGRSGGCPILLTATPDFLVNHKDNSHLLTGDLIFTPTNVLSKTAWYGAINSLTPVVSDVASFSWLFDIRSDNGAYTERGNNPAATTNFSRAGGRIGCALKSDATLFPITLVATETVLHGFSGSLGTLTYFATSVNFNLEKGFSLSVGFSNGRREDTGQAEHLWQVAFGSSL
jgi:hypothetical protein